MLTDSAPGRRRLREARLRPELADLYPGIPAGKWLPASWFASRLLTVDRLQLQPGANVGRLPQDHFDFRGGSPEHMLRRKARTRWADHPSAVRYQRSSSFASD